MNATYAQCPPAFDDALAALKAHCIPDRIAARDHTVWKPVPDEIANSLGWMNLPSRMLDHVSDLIAFSEDVRAQGFRDVLLVGMGGSSLAADALSHVFERPNGFPTLTVLDTTHPDAIAAATARVELGRTLLIVATKSGGTAETMSLFRHLYRLIGEHVGAEAVGARFVAITDPGSSLADLATTLHFRRVFLNDPNVGGRYSALSLFGLVPAALIGIDVRTLLQRALLAEHQTLDASHPGVRLGAFVGACARSRIDKATFLVSPPIARFGDWIEQLIAESTGKDGAGILPVIDEPPGSPEAYSDDRLFIDLRLAGDTTHDAAMAALAAAGRPLVRIELADAHDLGEQFYQWELATAVASHLLGVNPFDQPNVEAAKDLARRAVDAFRASGERPALPEAPATADALRSVVDGIEHGGYVAVHAYLPPSADTDRALRRLRIALRDQFGAATTVGYGPRFLHSTGQLHKGDAGRGRFIQLLSPPRRDIEIPTAPPRHDRPEVGPRLTFGTLIVAQAAGDRQALLDAGRRVASFVVGPDAAADIDRLADAL